MPAYAYLRKSVIHRGVRTDSPQTQEDAVRALAARHGDEDLVILSDWDKSGRLGRDQRPGYNTLLEAIEAGRATAIYSYSLSRLARSTKELSTLFDLCAGRGVPLRLEADVIDTSTAGGRMTANVLASVAQFESDVASERQSARNAAKRARGERVATTPFYGDGDGEDAAVVLAAFREAGSYSGVARLLNERKILPRTSKKGWWPSAVAKIVTRLDRSVVVRGSSKGARAGGSDFTLARLLRCPTCGTLLTGTRDRGGKRVRYSCRLGSVTPHPRVTVSEHLILPAIQAEVAHLTTPEAVESLADDTGQRADLEARRGRILDLYESGHIDKADRERRLSVVDEATSKLDAQRVMLAVPRIDWTWQPKALNAILRALFNRIDLDPATFQPQPVGFEWAVPEWRAPR